MPDQFTETSSEGWLSRLGGSVMGALLGIALFFLSFPLEVWNEGRAVAAMKALTEGAKTVMAVDIASINPSNDGKLVYISGPTKTSETLSDATFGVSANAVRLKREVKMYQWEENKDTSKKKKLGGGSETTTTYTYSKKWSDDLISSSDFRHPEGHENPGQMPFEDKAFTASDVKVGAFTLNPGTIDKLDEYKAISIGKIADTIEGRAAKVVDGNEIYLGKSSDKPEVGDCKVIYKELAQGPVSIIARQTHGTFEPFRTSNGRTIELAKSGTVSADEMFKEAEEESQLITWLVRGGGFLMMWFGICLVGKPISVLGDVIPFIGDLAEGAIGIFGFFVALILSLITISISWIAFRPIIAVAIIGVAVAICAGGVTLAKKKAAAK